MAAAEPREASLMRRQHAEADVIAEGETPEGWGAARATSSLPL
tara:strand:+ start:3206 stop:3334 length:129 start_codon:yes stop_codon:yes gene_type:complete